MLTKNINFKNFNLKKINKNIRKDLKRLLREKSVILNSLSTSYKNSYSKKNISNSKSYKNIRVIGMGGSILGTKAIYAFLRPKIKKSFEFISNLEATKIFHEKDNKYLNLIVSKS
jgi:glucose-6-phosphate isomerase